MSKIYYSPSKNAFYNTDINKKIPEDKTEITKARHEELMQEQTNGKVIESLDGKPVTITPTKEYKERLNHPKYYKLQNKKWVLDQSKKQELKKVIELKYDDEAKEIVEEAKKNMDTNIPEKGNREEFEESKFNFCKTQSAEKRSKKNKLNNKTMQELMDIYNEVV